GTNDVIDFWSNPGYTLSRLPMGGTTSCLATIVLPKSSSQPKTLQLFDTLKEVIGRTDTGGAVLEGINAEGPLVNDFGGLPESERDMTETDFELLIDSIPSIKIMTISPHIEARHNYKRLKLLIKKGIKPSLGHDKEASESEILDALRLSKEPMHITHLFNVCSFHHRLPGLVNIGLASVYPNLPEYTDIILPTVEVIGDLAHV
ncbi:PREDICTED: N-acetylglucosamine-6-phosphate deacetylase-like, partial [Amphimedon queenslandica]